MSLAITSDRTASLVVNSVCSETGVAWIPAVAMIVCEFGKRLMRAGAYPWCLAHLSGSGSRPARPQEQSVITEPTA